MSRSKDNWDKADIVAKIALPLVILVATLVINVRLAQLSSKEGDENRNLDAVRTFHSIYESGGRHVAIYALESISDCRLKGQLRSFVAWDYIGTLMDEFEPYAFETPHPDRRFHELGEHFDLWFATDPEQAQAYYSRIRENATTRRWKEVSTELGRYFDWMESTYRLVPNPSQRGCATP